MGAVLMGCGHHEEGDGEEVFRMGMGFGSLFWIVVIVVLIAIGLSYSKRRKSGRSSEDTAEEILKQRFARGEIGKAEFEERMEELRK
jgi:putative membrane protein